jgi:cytochrome c-type biogenesis protein
MNRIAGGLLVVAGAYVAYYGWYEIRVLDGATDDPIVDRAIELQTWLQNRIVPDDPVSFTTGAVIGLATLTAGVMIARRILRARQPAEPHRDLLLEGANDDAALLDGGTPRR